MDAIQTVLKRLGLNQNLSAVGIGDRQYEGSAESISSRSPINGSLLGTLKSASADDVSQVLAAASDAFQQWRIVPGPRRGEFVRRVGNRFRELKPDLAAVITWEAGKITQEALGEVQEVIDICDFAVGLSRQLYGLTIASERPFASTGGTVASTRSGRRHHGIQLSDGRVGLERGARVGLRGSSYLETFRKNTALCLGLPSRGRIRLARNARSSPSSFFGHYWSEGCR